MDRGPATRAEPAASAYPLCDVVTSSLSATTVSVKLIFAFSGPVRVAAVVPSFFASKAGFTE